jgi:hypothetical protein
MLAAVAVVKDLVFLLLGAGGEMLVTVVAAVAGLVSLLPAAGDYMLFAVLALVDVAVVLVEGGLVVEDGVACFALPQLVLFVVFDVVLEPVVVAGEILAAEAEWARVTATLGCRCLVLRMAGFALKLVFARGGTDACVGK